MKIPASIVLIDDDKLSHLSWKLISSKHGLELQSFFEVSAFLEVAHGYEREIVIFVDSDLGKGIRGEVESEKLFKLGFLNLYLSTGHRKEDIHCPEWIKEVLPKNPLDVFSFLNWK